MPRRTVVAAVVGAILVVLGLTLSGTAAATTEGIVIARSLTTATGRFDFTGAGVTGACDVIVTKTYNRDLVPVNRRGLTKLGRLGSGRTANCNFPTTFLNLPTTLDGRPAIGPNADSWDIAFISSNLTTNDINIAILDVQIQIANAGFNCLYRGLLSGTISASRAQLTFVTTFMRFAGNAGCPVLLTVTGTLVENPVNTYLVLHTRP